MNVYLVRHGQTYANAEKKFAGIWDVALNENGLSQAHEASQKLKQISFDRIFASDLKRAFHTAEIIAKPHKSSVIPHSDFREINFGDWEGKTYEEIKALDKDGMDRWISDYLTFNAHGGESISEVYKRVSNAYDSILSAYDKDSDVNVLIVAHGGVIQSLLSHICYNDLSGYWRFGVENCGINRVEYVMGYAVIKALNA